MTRGKALMTLSIASFLERSGQAMFSSTQYHAGVDLSVDMYEFDGLVNISAVVLPMLLALLIDYAIEWKRMAIWGGVATAASALMLLVPNLTVLYGASFMHNVGTHAFQLALFVAAAKLYNRANNMRDVGFLQLFGFSVLGNIVGNAAPVSYTHLTLPTTSRV